MNFWDAPFGVGFWLPMAGVAGCGVLIFLAGRTSGDRRRSALLSASAVLGLMGIQSLRLVVGSFEDSSRLQDNIREFGGSFVLDDVARFPIETLLTWFTGVVFGVTLMRLLQLLRPDQTAQRPEDALA